jgi:hypothetical protein
MADNRRRRRVRATLRPHRIAGVEQYPAEKVVTIGCAHIGHMVAERVGISLLARGTGQHFLLLTSHERIEFEAPLLDVALKAH